MQRRLRDFYIHVRKALRKKGFNKNIRMIKFIKLQVLLPSYYYSNLSYCGQLMIDNQSSRAADCLYEYLKTKAKTYQLRQKCIKFYNNGMFLTKMTSINSVNDSKGKQIKTQFNEKQEYVFCLLLGQYESRCFQGTARSTARNPRKIENHCWENLFYTRVTKK